MTAIAMNYYETPLVQPAYRHMQVSETIADPVEQAAAMPGLSRLLPSLILGFRNNGAT